MTSDGGWEPMSGREEIIVFLVLLGLSVPAVVVGRLLWRWLT